MLGWILSRAKTFVSQSGQFWVNIRELGLTLRLQLHQKGIWMALANVVKLNSTLKMMF